MSAASITSLFREWEALYRKAGDMSLEEEVATGIFDQCRDLEARMMKLPSSSATDLAAKVIVSTAYGDFGLALIGEGGVLDEALELVADPSSELETKISSFLAARETLLATAEDNEDAAWDAYCSTEREVIIHPCATIEDVRVKARFLLDCEPVYDTIRNCILAGEETLRPFLRSLVGEART